MPRSPLLAPDAPTEDPPAEPGSRTAPLSRGQRALWFLDRLAPESGAYIIAAAGRVAGTVDADALDRAFRALAERHPALRTTFEEVDGEPRRRVADRAQVRLARRDARSLEDDGALDGDRPDRALDSALHHEAFRPFDLERGPLVRLTLFERGPGEDLLLLSIHHLISDLWSLAVLLRELGALYDGQESLPPLEATFEDLVARQEERLAGDEGEQLWEFWRSALADRPDSLELPADRRRPTRRRQRGAAEGFRLEAELWKRLRKTGRRHGANPFVTALAGLAALLHRVSGQDDLVVGTPTAGRRDGDVSDLVGYCVNPVALRADAAGDPTFGELLERVRDAGKQAFEHQDFPFPLLVERLEGGRDAARSPIFQVLFSLQRSRLGVGEGMSGFALGLPGARLELGSLVLDSVPLEPVGAQFDLTVFAAEIGGELWGSLVYDRDLFDRTTARRMAGQLRRLLAEVAEAPERRLSELSLLGPAQRQQVLVEWNDIAPAGDPAGDAAGRGGRLDARVRAQADRTPDAVAVAGASRGAGGEDLTYGALARRTAALAARLRAAGVGSRPGDETRVGVCLPRTPEMIVALLAVLEAGGAYVPLDAAYPEERLAFMLEDSGATVVLASGETRDRLPLERLSRGHEHPVTVLDPGADGGTDASPAAPASAPGEPPAGDAPAGESLAYLIYTSGSTGRPKGVAISHGAAGAMIDWAASRFSADELAGVLAGTSICFDLSVFEIFLPLATGGRIVLAADALGVAEHADSGEVTLLNTVPSAMKELVAAGTLPRSVRTVNLAGEPLQRALVDAIFETFPGVERVYNLYGPSEDTTYSTCWMAARTDRADRDRDAGEPPIGVPITGGRAHVLDRALRPTPVGVPGELCLAGSGLARGYLGRPARTAASFVPDPFAALGSGGAGGGGRLYRTGDLARRRPDGVLEFLGRLDHQVKIRGFRIELGEIEAALVAHPRVAEAVVAARRPGDAGGGRRAGGAGELGGETLLVAYVVPSAEAAASGGASRLDPVESSELIDSLRGALGERLPAYMVPAAFELLDALPLTPNGKVDRKALPEPSFDAGTGSETAGSTLATPTEERLAGLFSEILSLPSGRPVGRDEDFFRLGGHSLLATRLVARVNETFGTEVSVAHRLRRADGGRPGARDRPGGTRARARGLRRHRATGRPVRGAALVRPAPALVPPPARAGVGGRQRQSGGRPRRSPRSGGAGGGDRRPGGAPRDPAHGPGREPRRSGAGDPPRRLGPSGATGGRPDPPRPGARPARRAGDRRRRGGTAGGDRPRAADAHDGRPPRPRRAPPGPGAAPRRRRRLVAGRPAARAVGLLRRPHRRAPRRPRGAADPVRRLRHLAAPAPGGGPARTAARLVAPRAGRRPGGPGAPVRPPPAPRAGSWGRDRPRPPAPGAGRAPRGVRPRALGDPVHGPAGRVRGAPRTAQRPGRPRPGDAERGTGPRRARGPDRDVRRHGRPARPARRRVDGGRAGRAGPDDRPERSRSPRAAVRPAGRRAGARALPRRGTAGPGPARPPERAPGTARAARPAPRAPAARRLRDPVRPGGGPRAPRAIQGRRAARDLALPGGAVRPDHRPADGAPAPDPARGDGRRAGPPPRGAAAAHLRPDPAGAGRVERHRRRRDPRPSAGRPVPLPGGPDAGRDRSPRSGAPHLRRARPADDGARPAPARGGRRGRVRRPGARGPGRRLPAAHPGPGGRPAGGARSRRRLPRPRSRRPGGAPRLHARGLGPDGGPGLRGDAPAPAPRPPGRGADRPRSGRPGRPGRDGRAGGGRGGSAGRRRPGRTVPGLPHLHLRLDRQAQGGRRHPRRRRRAARLGGRRLFGRRAFRRPGRHLDLLRPVVLRALLAARDRRPDRPRRRRPRCRRPHGHRRAHPGQHGAVGDEGAGRRRRPAGVGAHRQPGRRAAPARPGRRDLPAVPRSRAGLRPLRPLRGHHLLDLRPDRSPERSSGRERAVRRAADRPLGHRQPGPRARPGASARADRRPGGSSASPERASPAAIWDAPAARRRASFPTRSRPGRAPVGPAAGSTAPATWPAAARTAPSSSSAGSITRSRSAASASSSARSRPPWPPIRGSARPRSPRRSGPASPCWSPTWYRRPPAGPTRAGPTGDRTRRGRRWRMRSASRSPTACPAT